MLRTPLQSSARRQLAVLRKPAGREKRLSRKKSSAIFPRALKRDRRAPIAPIALRDQEPTPDPHPEYLAPTFRDTKNNLIKHCLLVYRFIRRNLLERCSESTFYVRNNRGEEAQGPRFRSPRTSIRGLQVAHLHVDSGSPGSAISNGHVRP